MKKGYAVITGASSGLGAEFARQLARQGYQLILVARREERLQKVAEEIQRSTGSQYRKKFEIRIITADLSETGECLRLMDEIKDVPVGVFVNNAGFGDCGHFLRTDLQKDLAMIDVNVRAVHLLTKLILRKMELQGRGYLLNVASSAGLIPAGPYMASYYASKAYVASLTRAAAHELRERQSNVYVGVLCPGPVNTEFNAVANVEFALPGIAAQECVREAVRGMKARRVVIIPTVYMKAAMIAGRFLPQELYIRIAGNQQKKKIRRK